MSNKAAVARYRKKHPERYKKHNARYHREHCEEVSKRKSVWYLCQKQKIQARNLATKTEVLTHYGNGLLCCYWEGCAVTDIDMLTLDHIDNNGAACRKSGGTWRDGAVCEAKTPELPRGVPNLMSQSSVEKRTSEKKE